MWDFVFTSIFLIYSSTKPLDLHMQLWSMSDNIEFTDRSVTTRDILFHSIPQRLLAIHPVWQDWKNFFILYQQVSQDQMWRAFG